MTEPDRTQRTPRPSPMRESGDPGPIGVTPVRPGFGRRGQGPGPLNPDDPDGPWVIPMETAPRWGYSFAVGAVAGAVASGFGVWLWTVCR